MVLINRKMEELRDRTSDWLPLRGCLSLSLALGSLTLEAASCHGVKSWRHDIARHISLLAYRPVPEQRLTRMSKVSRVSGPSRMSGDDGSSAKNLIAIL